MSVLTALAERLAAGNPGVPVFAGARDPVPDEALNVQTYGGPPGRHLDDRNHHLVEFVAFQVMSRAASQEIATRAAERAYVILPGRHVVLDGVRYDWIEANHRPAYVGVDQNGRALVSVNFTARRDGPATREGVA